MNFVATPLASTPSRIRAGLQLRFERLQVVEFSVPRILRLALARDALCLLWLWLV
jgi:hypothetical protein